MPMLYESLMGGTFLAAALPDAMVVVCFSGIGFSHRILGLVAREGREVIQALSAAVSFLALLLYILLDIGRAPKKVWLPYAFVSFACVLALSISMSLNYSWASPFLCLQSSFVLLGYMRNNVYSEVSTKDFFTATALSLSICGSVVLAIWMGWRMSVHFDLFTTEFDIFYAAKNVALTSYLSRDLDLAFDYSTHCMSNNSSAYEQTVRESLGAACGILNDVVQMQQWCPAVVGAINIMSAVCCTFMLQGQASMKGPRVSEQRTQEGMLSEEELQAALRLQAILKRSLLVITCLAAIAYAAASTSGSAAIFTQAFYAFGIGGAVTILGYVYVETDHALLHKLMTQTRFGKIVLSVFRNEWMRAFLICMFNFAIPVMLLVDLLRQKVRRLRNMATSPEAVNDKFTPMGRRVIDDLRAWNWAMILRKVDILSFICILLFVGLKATYVFFSWLNYFLLASELNTLAMCGLVFVIGFLMFMLPIVPGTAVYLFSGVVLGVYAASTNKQLVEGIILGSVLTSVLKHVACTGQYFIGYLAGKSVHVQRFVGVDKVPTRAMEMILNKRGFALGKVCILVAGPDFPTSVLCGILKLNIPQMLLGTTPVIFVSIIPQVTVGALLTVPGNAKEYSAVATVFAGALQVLATLYVSYKILKTAEENYQELSQHREEHQQVAELTKQEASYTRKFLEVSSWPRLSFYVRAMIVLSSTIFWGAAFVLVIDFFSTQKICFRRFSMTDRIEDDLAGGGLGGNVWNIVIQPLGSIVLGSTLLACLLHVFVGVWLDRVTRRQLQLVGPGLEGSWDSPIPDGSGCTALAKQATELEHFFPQLKLTIIDFLPRCLGPLPDGAAEYCSEYMSACGIKEFYNCKYDPKNPEFWKQIELPNGADEIYVCIGVKASNYFMPAETLSDKGPGGGGWIHFNKHLQVTKKPSLGGQVWADGSIYAVGDCNYGCIGEPGNWEMPPVPKISYPGEEQAYHACLNVMKMAKGQSNLVKTWWPWGAGMFATSLGPHDACFVAGANENKNSGYMVNWWIPAALQKEIIETTKIDECRDRWIGILIWHFVHHTPVHLFGRGPWFV